MILGSVLPFGQGIYTNERVSQINFLNSAIENIALKNEFHFINFFSILSDNNGYFKPDLTDDGRHPNFQGYIVMTKLVNKTLLRIPQYYDY